MMLPARNPSERSELVRYLARKIGGDPFRLVGPTPFEVTAIVNSKMQVVGAVYYTNFRRTSIEMGWAGERGWLTKGTLADMFGYPFNQLGVQRVWGLVHRHNKDSRRLAERMGCRFVGTADGEYGPGQDAIIYSMTRGACRWIDPKPIETAHDPVQEALAHV